MCLRTMATFNLCFMFIFTGCTLCPDLCCLNKFRQGISLTRSKKLHGMMAVLFVLYKDTYTHHIQISYNFLRI